MYTSADSELSQWNGSSPTHAEEIAEKIAEGWQDIKIQLRAIFTPKEIFREPAITTTLSVEARNLDVQGKE